MESLRGTRPVHDPRRPAGWLVESEAGSGGAPVRTLTVFLTNRECPWRCVFCDLWQHTLERPVLPGDVPAQLDLALAGMADLSGPVPRHLKLYNAGSFFDPGAIPVGDHPTLARRAAAFDRVIVECHPALVGDRVWRFREMLSEGARQAGRARDPVLEVAMGLETVNPDVLPRLNKQVTAAGFRRAATALTDHGIAVRAFVLVQPPYEAAGEAVLWASRSTAFALECGAEVVVLIPVRGGNGALEALAAGGLFRAPTLSVLESAIEEARGLEKGWGAGRRVLADLWDLERFSRCAECFPARRARLESMNWGQVALEKVRCSSCDGSGT